MAWLWPHLEVQLQQLGLFPAWTFLSRLRLLSALPSFLEPELIPACSGGSDFFCAGAHITLPIEIIEATQKDL